MVELTELVPIALRWFHIAAGITWIGLLYFFNLVNVPAMKAFDGPTKTKIVTTMLPRALWWFRWGAAVTVLFGLLLMESMARAAGGWSAFAQTPTGPIIMMGGFIGIVMMINVWAIIWPNQKKVIAAAHETLKNGTPAPAEAAGWARHAFLASRTNFVLSLPMLVMMGASSHYPDVQGALILGAVAALGGLVWVWYLGQPKKAPAPVAPPAAATPPAQR